MHNMDKNDPDTVGFYGIPAILAVNDIPAVDKWLGFREKTEGRNPATLGIHFFLDDYRFESVWRFPDRYAEHLRKFASVLSPDFSMYTDMPRALQIYNHYRKQWLSAYWQKLGVNVIPTISWSDEESFSFCFDGVPRGGIVAVSSVGCMRQNGARELFAKGYAEMMRRLQPSAVLYYGGKHCNGPEIIDMGPPFYEKFEKNKEVI